MRGGRGADLNQSAALTSKGKGVKAADNNRERARNGHGGCSWKDVIVRRKSPNIVMWYHQIWTFPSSIDVQDLESK